MRWSDASNYGEVWGAEITSCEEQYGKYLLAKSLAVVTPPCGGI
jgi:hypothetical protein